MAGLVLSINNLTRRRVDEGVMKKAAEKTLMLLKKGGRFELSIALVGEKRMQSLNWKFRRENRPTDVLSFDFQEGAGGKSNFLGEIIICLSYAEKQARELGIGLKENLATLTAHGVIHLCGVDHERSDAERLKTLKVQKQVLKKIKFQNKSEARNPKHETNSKF